MYTDHRYYKGPRSSGYLKSPGQQSLHSQESPQHEHHAEPSTNSVDTNFSLIYITYLSLCLSFYLCLSIYIYLSIYLPTYLPTYLSIYLASTNPCLHSGVTNQNFCLPSTYISISRHYSLLMHIHGLLEIIFCS